MRFLLVLCLVFVISASYSQNNFRTIDREEVKKQVTGPASPNYYEKLLARFKSFDTTLTVDDYRLIYYGFAFEKKYSGYANHSKKEIIDHIRNERYMQATLLCDSVLEKIPVSLVANSLKGFAMMKIKETDPSALHYRDRYFRLVDAILSSGDGLTCPTAFKVLFVDDEYDLMYNHFDVKKFLGQSLQAPCDKMKIEPTGNFKSDAIFFDVSESLLSLQNMFKEKK